MNRFLAKKVDPLLITRDDAAALLNISVRSLINMERDGKLRPIKLRSSVRHSRKAIDDFIAIEQFRPPGCTDDLSFLL